MKKRNWFWGICFICAAAFVLLSHLGVFLEGIGVFGAIMSVVLVAIIVESIIHLNFFGITLPIVFLLMIYRKFLGISLSIMPERGMPWALLITAILLALGLSIIFRPKWKRDGVFCGWNAGKTFNRTQTRVHKSTTVLEGDTGYVEGEEVSVNVRFGSTTKYVNSSNLKRLNLSCAFGAMEIFLDNVQIAPEGAEIYFDISFSGIEIYIPKTWRIENSIDCTLGGVEDKNRGVGTVDGPLVRLTGNVNLSGVEIIYI